MSLLHKLNFAMEHNYAKPDFNAPEKPKINKVLLEMATADLETVQNLEAAFWTLLLQEPMSKRWHTLKTVRRATMHFTTFFKPASNISRTLAAPHLFVGSSVHLVCYKNRKTSSSPRQGN